MDSATGSTIVELLRGAVDKKRTVVLVTHSPKLAQLGDRVLTIKDGRLADDSAGN